ncbi:MAG TPA: PspC domain-containing protein [bacterium]|nr:PspC domain-containing protein [bacterium]
MKKTLSITIGGLVYNIEEDAFLSLDAYLEKLRSHFSSDENVDELIADIEASISEKFAEKLEKRTVIRLQDVEEVIAVMGKAEEIDEEATTESQKQGEQNEQKSEESTEKRLYRDVDDMVIAGVCSGIAAYYGVDVVFVRIAFIILAFVNGIGILLYLILWLAMAKAITPSQKLSMRGRPVNVNELQDAIKEKAKTMTNEGKEAVERIKSNDSLWKKIAAVPVAIIELVAKAGNALFRLIVPFVATIIGIVFTLSSFAALVGITIIAGVLLFNIQSPQIISDLPLQELAGNPAYYVGVVAGYFSTFIPVLVGIVAGISLLLRRNLFSILLGTVFAGIWIVAVTTWVICGVQLSPWLNDRIQAAQDMPQVTKNLELKDFDRVYAGSYGTFVIKEGPVFSVQLKGTQAAIDNAEATTVDGVLFIAQTPVKQRGICLFCHNQRVTGEITMPVLKQYKGSGIARADVEGFKGDLELLLTDAARFDGARLDLAKITLRLEDASRASLEGKALVLDAELTDAARLQADQLRVDVITINTKDAARAELWPLQSIAATSTAASRINLVNNPPTSTLINIGNSQITVPSITDIVDPSVE